MLLGEHRLSSKSYLYREDLRIPVIVRVPGATEGAVSTMPITTVDLAPTIADLTGAVQERLIDGDSFAPALRGEAQTWRDTQLVQTGSSRTAGPDPGWDLRGVYTRRFTYMPRPVDGGEFLYDRKVDPYELVNRALSDPYHAVLVALRARYQALRDCAGGACNRVFGPLPTIPGAGQTQ